MRRGLILLLLMSLTAPAEAQDTQRHLRHGEALVTSHCAACHNVGRAGESPVAQALPLRTLGRRYPVESLQEALGEGILVGHPLMPEFRFSPSDVGDVLAYLNAIQTK